MPTPLLIGPAETEALQALRSLAATHPVDIPGLLKRLKNPRDQRRHMLQMTGQTIIIPIGFTVTFSIETGHPCGTARHMSMASRVVSRAPTPEAVWMVAELLGFAGSLQQCAVWLEDLAQGKAVNVVQPIDVYPATTV